MKSRILMIILFILFVSLLSLGFLYYRSKLLPVRDFLPITKEPISTVTEVTSTPVPLDPFTEKGKSLINDLNKINGDLQKIKFEDIKMTPPEFIFDKNLPQ